MALFDNLYQALWPWLWDSFSFNELTSYSLLLLLLLLSFLLLVKLKRVSSEINLPPSPPKLPVIGNLHQLGKLPHRSLAALSEKYGPLMLLKLGPVSALVISSSEMVKEVIKSHDIVFSDRPQITAAKILLYGCRDMGFAPFGEYWRQIRKICVLELLSLKRIESYRYMREEEVSVMVNKISEAVVDGKPLNLTKLLTSTSNSIMSRSIMGQKFEDENGRSSFAELAREAKELFASFCLGDFFPSLSFVDDVLGTTGKLEAISRKFDAYFERLIEEREANYSQESEKKDVIDILIQLQKSGNLELDLTRNDLKAVAMDLFVGGSDSTSTALEWTMAEMMRNPLKLKKAQEETRRVVGKDSKIGPNHIKQMNYLDCVLKETLRLHPSSPLLVPRQTSETVKVGGFVVPAKTRVFINAWAIQRDPRKWENPNEYIPERFIEDSIDFLDQDFKLLPFGCGRRGCPGMAFALTSAKYVLASLLHWFDRKLPEEEIAEVEALDMAETNGITVHKTLPIRLLPLPYSPDALPIRFSGRVF